jgi:hypothetical protein
MGLKISRHKNEIVMKIHTDPRTWKDPLDKRTNQKNTEVRFGTGIIRSLYRAGSLVTVSK